MICNKIVDPHPPLTITGGKYIFLKAGGGILQEGDPHFWYFTRSSRGEMVVAAGVLVVVKWKNKLKLCWVDIASLGDLVKYQKFGVTPSSIPSPAFKKCTLSPSTKLSKTFSPLWAQKGNTLCATSLQSQRLVKNYGNFQRNLDIAGTWKCGPNFLSILTI